MKYNVEGTFLQLLEIELERGEQVYTESGGMAWMSDGFEMKTDTKGGLMKGLGRALAGESLFMTTYKCIGERGKIVFTPEAPGKIMDMRLEAGQSLICQKDAFMCAEDSVKLEMHFRKRLGAGLFGGEGFILQKVTGPGTVFLEIPGEVKEYNLSASSHIKVDPGHIAFFEPSVSYDIATVKGVKNILFSGEGLFLASVRGPGRIWLQTMPISNLAQKIAKYLPQKSG
ncbi:MAG: TIGR00266 family protein [Anaerolineaceae bacterium]|nr:TIGR00266 family protein [Anaerolineaceae bacterium]